MRAPGGRLKLILTLSAALVAVPLWTATAPADPSKYPEFAQQTVPPGVKLVFISIEELVKEL